MATTSTDSGAAPAPLGLLSRLIGVIASPKAPFESIVAPPRWLGMLLLVCVSVSVLVGGFLLTPVGQDAWLQTATAGRTVTDQQYAGMQRVAPFLGYLAVVQMFVF